MRTICGAKAWHCDANDTFAIEVEFIECLDCDEQCQGGVETTTDTNHRLLGIDMVETLGKTCHLDIQDFLTGRLHIFVLGDKRMGIDLALKFEVTYLRRLTGHLQRMRMTLGIDERRVLTTLYTQFLDINLTGFDLWLDTETIALYQQMSILIYHRISTIDQILGRFAKTTAGIDIAADGAGTLLSKQRLEISMLTNQFVAG